MRRPTLVRPFFAAAVVLPALTLLAACGDDPRRPWIRIDGGGFIFNYRIAEAFYGVSVKPMRRLPEGTVLEAEFQDPAGGPPHIVRETVAAPQLGYSLSSPPVKGVVAGRDYRVVVRVREAKTGHELARIEQSFRSDLDQSILPEKPLTVGPGYTPNPDHKP